MRKTLLFATLLVSACNPVTSSRIESCRGLSLHLHKDDGWVDQCKYKDEVHKQGVFENMQKFDDNHICLSSYPYSMMPYTQLAETIRSQRNLDCRQSHANLSKNLPSIMGVSSICDYWMANIGDDILKNSINTQIKEKNIDCIKVAELEEQKKQTSAMQSQAITAQSQANFQRWQSLQPKTARCTSYGGVVSCTSQ